MVFVLVAAAGVGACTFRATAAAAAVVVAAAALKLILIVMKLILFSSSLALSKHLHRRHFSNIKRRVKKKDFEPRRFSREQVFFSFLKKKKRLERKSRPTRTKSSFVCGRLL